MDGFRRATGRVPRPRLILLAAGALTLAWIVGFHAHGHTHGVLALTDSAGNQQFAREWRLGQGPSAPVQISAGEVTLSVENTGVTAHDFAVIRTGSVSESLPLRDGRVDLDSAGEVVAAAEPFAPGETAERTLSLEPGTYILFCDVEGHYQQGMYYTLEVR